MIQTELGEGDKISKELESGMKHIISRRNAEGYDNSILEIRYDKFGTLSKKYLFKQNQTRISCNFTKTNCNR